ncbi:MULTISPECIES: DUF3253 domain-containing protein [Mycolicibacterium]|uniref:DUF3253 domain-containing protein n=3 Tax=Mycolicibacterium gilvum TaxID=1804 RepID=E6TK58_MYCSR|nr:MULTISPECIES: DUF3253 domain-containing protein [Mycolicibacterium]ABP45719.1 hypothetical protein Mflv_3242 [Mycolicibacterium gilvum PYR-GCK]ADT99203.1 hypothetical protein Mspyr1_25690 [Mycolicibacterium gilvum Spyr1]MBV5243665.1 DUF3253 domain-containing protein [Mycolicibacterium sp. PAM1]MCV7056775.1 DUF3253 domain-containing protein [Mycolicibacterium gilvum]STZ43922.1 Protein of uncharacterised function (DUF3253) [Mycolicibacterium gilvum]
MPAPLHSELTRIAAGDGRAATAARTALGEGPTGERLAAALRALATHRGPGSSTCPSDAARAVGGSGWRELMDEAREISRRLAISGEVEITQGGEVIDPDGDWRGPIRIRIVRDCAE